MLRLYKPIDNDIKKLHLLVKSLVCNVWCKADKNPCADKLDSDLKDLYDSYGWLKAKIDEIYLIFQNDLDDNQRKLIKYAFIINNKTEKLCEGIILPVKLDRLHEVVEKKIKPLFVDFYETLLERAKVPGTKKEYYEKLIEENDFQNCPCCGLIDFEDVESENREAFDHYLPKSKYPFASVNFDNLVPLCHKCNSDRKGDKDPIENGNIAFYPFSANTHNIGINIVLDKSKNLGELKRKDLVIDFLGDTEKLESWERVFGVKKRYNDTTRKLIKSHLRKIKRRHLDYSEGKINWTYVDSLNKMINDYRNDYYEDKKFLKIALMMELKNCTNLISVYGESLD